MNPIPFFFLFFFKKKIIKTIYLLDYSREQLTCKKKRKMSPVTSTTDCDCLNRGFDRKKRTPKSM